MSDFGLAAWPFLGLVLLIPLGMWIAGRQRRRLPLAGAGTDLPLSRGGVWALWPTLFRLGALVLIASALAGPVRTVRKVEQRSEGTTILVACLLYTSPSPRD